MITLLIANFVLQYGEPKFDTKQLMQSEAQRIFNQYSQIIKDEKKPQVFGFINQQTNSFLKRMEEHRQILKQQIEQQLKISQGNILLQKALLSYELKKMN
ncbi:unnamed protein product (macronuclear) [Paramecium tetraurelia]|uniref:Uncharacterized protein n=1 Tax=Paramecium tetraurelia TaxID=5888 RepID=A0DUD3_PARTE|nr:uncharacterized protein GSPATT00020322001 [Paramecium tetraurelia]CAK86650.1 unnamed protein product [Paramecium tetraurelia]|eukprot:XP_001454047.1 hypothetical protein (macronuclear) [Paramecium tetraurelia strain d4-2]